MEREKLQQLSAWMGFVGIITIIGGVLTAIAGVFALIVGAIPGIITIVLGVKLRSAKKHADAMLLESTGEALPDSFNLFIANLNTYFKIQGVLIIISMAMAVLGALFGVFAGFAFYQYQGF